MPEKQGSSAPNDEQDPVAPGIADSGLEEGSEHKGQVSDQRAEEEGQGDRRGDVHPVFLCFAELGDQRVVRRAVHGHEQVEEDQENKDPDDVDRADRFHRRKEHQDRDHRKGNGRPLHKGNAPALRVPAPVREGGNPGIRHRVKDPAKKGDQAEHRQHAEDHQARRHIELRPRVHRALRRQVEGHKPGVDDAAEDGPAQLANRKNPHFLFCQTSGFHTVFLLSIWF